MSNGSPTWWQSKDWWIEHWADVLGAIVIPLLLYMVDCNGKKSGDRLVQQQISLQQLSMTQTAADLDNHQAIALVADLATRTEAAQLPQRRAVALALFDYALQGRLYHPSTGLVIGSLSRECDPTTYGLLNQAVEEALKHTPKNEQISCDEKNEDKSAARSCKASKDNASQQVESDNATDTNTLAGARKARAQACTQTPVEPALAVLRQFASPGQRTFRQYLDVGCAETNQGSLPISLSDEERKSFKIAGAPKPHFEGISNLNWANADQPVIDSEGDSMTVNYSIRGLDREFLGNCPGGGHATLVVDYQLAPRAQQEQQQQKQ